MYATKIAMRLGYRSVACAVFLVLGLGMTIVACSQTANEVTGPVVTVYATPT